MKSICNKIADNLSFPDFKGRLLYMHKTKISDIILPKEFLDYKELIHKTLSKIKAKIDICYLTIDEKMVDNCTHRRAGVHVDFNWYEGSPIQDPTHQEGAHVPAPPGHKKDKGIGDGSYNLGGMLLISNYPGCKAYIGDYRGEISEGGDCSSIDLSPLASMIMAPNAAYYVNAYGIHEPLVINEKVNRSLLRINFHPEDFVSFTCLN